MEDNDRPKHDVSFTESKYCPKMKYGHQSVDGEQRYDNSFPGNVIRRIPSAECQYSDSQNHYPKKAHCERAISFSGKSQQTEYETRDEHEAKSEHSGDDGVHNEDRADFHHLSPFIE